MKNMTQTERFEYILKLEADNREQQLAHRLSKAKHDNKIDALNIGVSIAVMHTNLVIMAAFGGIER